MIPIFRLYSGNFEIFYLNQLYPNLSSEVKTDFKIIQNEINIRNQLQNFLIENRLFNFCVGETVGGKPFGSLEGILNRSADEFETF